MIDNIEFYKFLRIWLASLLSLKGLDKLKLQYITLKYPITIQLNIIFYYSI